MIKVNEPKKITYIKHGKTRNMGKPYTLFRISCSRKGPDGEWIRNYISVFCNDNIEAEKGDMITIKEISAVSVGTSINNPGAPEFTIYVNADKLEIEPENFVIPGSADAPWDTSGEEMPF